MSNLTSPEKQAEILRLLAKGNSIRRTARLTDTAPSTVRSIKLRGVVKEAPKIKPEVRTCPICKNDYPSDFIFKHIWLYHAKTTKETNELIANS